MSVCMNFGTVKTSALLIVLFLPSTMLLAEETASISSAAGSATEERNKPAERTTYNFPRWPEPRQEQREIIPPPPPGPYMSLALSNFSSIEPAFGDEAKEANDGADSSVVVDAFSPDRPWPKVLRPVKRWMPEDGYRYVNSQASKQSNSAAQNRPSANYNYGYRPAPDMNWSGPNWMPAMNAGTAVPYAYPPNYAPAYNYPVTNNPGVQSGYQSYRAPYAATNKP